MAKERGRSIDELNFDPLASICRRSRQGAQAVDDAPASADNSPGVIGGAADLDTDAPSVALGADVKPVRLGNEIVNDEGDELERRHAVDLRLSAGAVPVSLGALGAHTRNFDTDLLQEAHGGLGGLCSLR